MSFLLYEYFLSNMQTQSGSAWDIKKTLLYKSVCHFQPPPVFISGLLSAFSASALSLSVAD